MAQRIGSTTVEFAAASHVGGLTHMTFVTDQPPVAEPQVDELAKQLDKTVSDLRTLGEELGAIQPPRRR
jgi:hypothetical protein